MMHKNNVRVVHMPFAVTVVAHDLPQLPIA